MILNKNHINMGIGFVTGRKGFKNLVKTYTYSWKEHNLVDNDRISLNLFVAYDLKYSNTKVSDYKNIDSQVFDWLDSANYIGGNTVLNEIKYLVVNGVINSREAKLIFGEGYGKKRNVIVYFALKQNMDYLLFVDDDEYPVAPVITGSSDLIWKGQTVVATHLKHIGSSDITHGHHCGYISPIPYMEFDSDLGEEDFRIFIEAISNDIISWDSIKEKMKAGGVTFADNELIDSNLAQEVKESNGCKFISGSNLCLNLNSIEKLAPFYNPPGARGEDTFLSTCLSDVKVLKVPCYTFHDGFLKYPHLLHGVLPSNLKPIKADSRKVVSRFVKASIGWVRYKPLLLYITRRGDYDAQIEKMRSDLKQSIPKLCKYFNTDEFVRIYDELDYYDRNVQKHLERFEETREAWKRIVAFLKSENRNAHETSSTYSQEIALN